MSHTSFKNPIGSDPNFQQILFDTDTVELFNRDTLFNNNNQSWLGFIHEKRLKFQRDRRRLTTIFLSMVGVFSLLSVIFLISAIVSYNDVVENPALITDNLQLSANFIFNEKCQDIPLQDRIDCNPDPPSSREECTKRGCCWNPNEDEVFLNYTLNLLKTNVLPPLNVPWCYYSDDYVGYKIKQNDSSKDHTIIQLEREHISGFPNDILNVDVDINELSNEIVRIKITDAKKSRYEVPVPKLNLDLQSSSESKLYTVELEKTNLVIRRKETGQEIFSVNLAIMVYSDQLIQITSKLPSESIYGLGEHREPFRKSTNWKRYTMLNRDQYPLPDMALYGSHPFYLSVEEKTETKPASGVFLFNSNPMDIITQPSPAITFRTIGGILDFFIFLGPKPEDVIKQYHSLIGLPLMPPYWSMGYHLSRYGYKSLENLNATFTRNIEEKIPVDIQWTDIDMFDSNNDFTYDSKRFNGMPDFIENTLHKNGIKFIPMFDCGISAGEAPKSYTPFDVGMDMQVFVRNSSDQVFFGKVWNTKSTVWPDFFHPNATDYWSRMFQEYHKNIPFDGAWIDMNEPSNFFDGQNDGCPQSELENPRYTPGMVDESLKLRRKTLCMTAKHHNNLLHYNVHNLYALQETIVTNAALKKTLNKRPFIISRASAPGQGHWGYHWSGDIVSDWPSMKWSIASLLNFNMFGIPMMGSDICGFNGDTTEELCARWHQLGAFYTFARNHNADNSKDQDPAALGAQVVEATRNAFLIRYAHLPYLYTLFYQVHKNGGTVVRPLFFEFSEDEKSYKIDTQFMWGSSLMIAPALEPKQEKVQVYFPKTLWFAFQLFRRIESNGEFKSEPAANAFPNVYYRAGSIVPTQRPSESIELTRKGNFILVVVLENENSEATGNLYWDSGDGLDTEEKGLFNYYDFSVKDDVLSIESTHLGFPTNQTIEEIIILGFSAKPQSVSVDGQETNFDYIDKEYRLVIPKLSLKLFNDETKSSSSNNGQIKHSINWKIN